MIKDDNYFVIQGYMVNKFDLSGNELMIYAIINGFSQEPNSWYDGSLSYLANFINCKSKTTILNILKNLQDKNLIIIEEYIINNVKFCKYRTVYQNLIWGISKKVNKFVPPTLEEVQDYINQKQLNVNAKQFYEYFEVGNWKDSKGNQVKNWKQKLLTWDKFNSNKSTNTKKETLNEMFDRMKKEGKLNARK